MLTSISSNLFRTNSIKVALMTLLMAMLSPNVLAQDDTNPVRECLQRMGHIAHNTIEFNHQTANRTVHSIRVLADEGAPEIVIVGTGRIGRATIERRSHAAVVRIHRVADECIARLSEHDAPPAAIEAVMRGATASSQAIHESADRAKAHIAIAVHEATEG